MNRLFRIGISAVIVITSANIVFAHSHKIMRDKNDSRSHSMNGLKIEKSWARATLGRVKNGAAYLRIVNVGEIKDRLMMIKGGVAKRIEIHTHLMDNGVMRMRQVDGIDLPVGGTVEMKPGGYHIMLIGLYKPLKVGDFFPLTLVFEKAGEYIIQVEVTTAAAMGDRIKGNMQGFGHHKGH